MGQKANVNGLHLTNKKDWNSTWYAVEKDCSALSSEDLTLFNYLKSCEELGTDLPILRMRLCRISRDLIIDLQLAFEKQTNSDEILKRLAVNVKILFPQSFNRIFIISKSLRLQELQIDAVYLSRKVANLLENRVKFKSYMVRTLATQTREICNGVKILCKGRLNGADMAGNDFLLLGSIPFQSFKAKIDYGFSVANTAKGLLSVKVWVCSK